MHVVMLLLAIPVIMILAGLMVWGMGGTAWDIAVAAVLAWLLLQVVYFTQIMVCAGLQRRREGAGRQRGRKAAGKREERPSRSMPESDWTRPD